MKNNLSTLKRSLFGGILAAATMTPYGAMANSADADLNVTAGLSEALSLTCGKALNFGTTTLAGGNRKAPLKVDVSASQQTLGDGTESGMVLTGANPGECSISGGDSGGKATVTFDTGGTETAVGLGGADTDGPGTAADLIADNFAASGTNVSADGTVTIGTDGTVTFKIGGTLTIPQTLDASNMGGYEGKITVNVEEVL